MLCIIIVGNVVLKAEHLFYFSFFVCSSVITMILFYLVGYNRMRVCPFRYLGSFLLGLCSLFLLLFNFTCWGDLYFCIIYTFAVVGVRISHDSLVSPFISILNNYLCDDNLCWNVFGMMLFISCIIFTYRCSRICRCRQN